MGVGTTTEHRNDAFTKYEEIYITFLKQQNIKLTVGKIFTITEKDIYRRIDKLILKQLICLGITPLIVIWWSDFNDNPIMGTISSSMESLFRRSAPNDQIMPQKWIEKRMQMHQKYNGIGDNFSCLKQQLQQKTQRIKYLNVLNEKAKKRPQKQVDKLKEQIEKASYQIQEEDKKQTDMIGKPQMLKIIQITFYKKIKIIGGKFKFLSFLMKF